MTSSAAMRHFHNRALQSSSYQRTVGVHGWERTAVLSSTQQHRRLCQVRLWTAATRQTSGDRSLTWGSIDAFGSQYRIHFVNSSTSRTLSSYRDGSWRTALSELWLLQKPKEGSGFENFFPKKKTTSKEKTTTSNEQPRTKEEPTKESVGSGNNKESSAKERPKDGDGGVGAQAKKDYKSQNDSSKEELEFEKFVSQGFSNNNFFANYGIWVLIFLYLAFDMMRFRQSNDPNSENEIDWRAFVLGLVETDQVEKIVIMPQKTWATVVLKPGSQGLRHDLIQTQQSFSQPHHEDATGDGSAPHEASTHQHHEPEEDVVEGLSYTMQSAPGLAVPTDKRRILYRLNIGSVDLFERKLQEVQRGLGRPPSKDIPVQFAKESDVVAEFYKVLPTVAMILVPFFIMRSIFGGSGFGVGGGGGSEGGGGPLGNIFRIGRSTAQKIGKEDIKVRFADVAGCEEAKKEIMEFVEFLQDPTIFTKLGAKIPKGALLCGPPGTGKTLLAKAVAGEAGVPFFSISGSNFVEMFVGVGPARVRDLFREARKEAPCIVFIDEIDAVGRKRSRAGVGNDESENTLNQLLVEMDGFSPSSGVVVLAATNRVDILDQALIRPGRFDRQVQIDKPDLKGRRQIFMVHLKALKLEDQLEDIAGRLSGLTPGFVGADIANICNEAAIIAARRSADAVALEDFEKAIDRNIGGMESNKIMSKDERNIVAHHEAGHAVAGWFLEHADPLLKVTIIPRTNGALGFAQYLPKEVFLRSQDQIMDIVCMALAGRAAEEVFFGNVTTGASDDLRRVTDIVYNMIQVFGMNPRLGQLAFPKDPNAYWDERPYSEKTAQAMDEEAKLLVDAAYQRTVDLIREKKDQVEKVANLLLSQETITHDDIVELIGPRPFQGDVLYQEFIERRKQDKNKKDEEKSNKEEELSNDTPKAEDLVNPGLA